jgi:FtsZ-interacting cell division protein YlmF
LGSYEILSPPLDDRGSVKPELQKLASYTNPIREDTDDEDDDDNDDDNNNTNVDVKEKEEAALPPESNFRPSLGGKRMSSKKMGGGGEKMGRRNSAPTRSELRAKEIGTYVVVLLCYIIL